MHKKKRILSLTIILKDDRLPIRLRSFLLSEIMVMIRGDNHQYCFSQMKTDKIPFLTVQKGKNAEKADV